MPPVQSHRQNKSAFGWAVLVCVVSGVVLFSRIERTKFHGDESGWISSGGHYADLLLRGEVDRDKWACSQCGNWGSLNMHLGKWLIGIPQMLDTQARGRGFFNFYRFDTTLEENIREGRVPPRGILLRARSVSVAFGVLCCILVFAIGYFSFNTCVGLLASVLLMTNRLFVESATRAMTDVYYNFFLLSLCLAVILLSKNGLQGHVRKAALLCGIIAGLACSIKITGLVIGGCFFAAVVIREHVVHPSTKREVTRTLSVFGLGSLVVIYGLNPYFWPSPPAIVGTEIIRELEGLSEAAITGNLHTYADTNSHPQLSNLGSVLNFPRLFRRWEQTMAEQTRQESASWHGNRFLSFHKTLLFTYGSFPGDWIFLGIGALCYFRESPWRRESASREIWLITCLYFVVNYVFILLFMKLNWDRYYLPTVIADRLLVAGGLYVTATGAYRYGRDRISK